jgi:RNA polymerase sigma-70 factor (ECF subfamily)
MAEDPRDFTILLKRWKEGDENAASELLNAVYADLKKVAGGYMRRERMSHTLQPTALLHEAWLRLSQSNAPMLDNREQFFRAMAAHMRRQLVDHARRRAAEKRGGGVVNIEFDDAAEMVADTTNERHDALAALEHLDVALEKLTAVYPRAARIVELRVFAGRSVEEVASELGIGSGTVKRDFALAKDFLLKELGGLSSLAARARALDT